MLTLFAALDARPPRERETDAFKTKDHELARTLGLGGQWVCSRASVTDRRLLRSASMTGPTYADHQKVRGVRAALLKAINEKASPALGATGAA
jgi:hypothetical protein